MDRVKIYYEALKRIYEIVTTKRDIKRTEVERICERAMHGCDECEKETDCTGWCDKEKDE